MTTLLLVFVALCLQCINAAQYRVVVGWQAVNDDMGPQWYSLWFYPPQLTIAYGDSVSWVSPTVELHNVVFTNGIRRSETQPNGVNLTDIAGVVGNTTHFTDYNLDYSSGFRAANAVPYELTFIPNSGSGTFQYYCSIHVGMDGVITVLPAGQTAPLTPAQVNSQVDAQIASMKSNATTASQEIDANKPQTGPQVPHTVQLDGSINWQVVGGQMVHGDGMQMYARFLPTYLEIQVGDTVTWSIGGEDPHWVFFNAAQTFPPLLANFDELAGQPLNASISYFSPPYVLGPIWFPFPPMIPLQTWPNPAGLINSGLMFGADGPPVFPHSISVRFTTTGSWRYSCPIHAALGMFGQVVVKPRGALLCTNATVAQSCARVPGAVRGDPQFIGLLGQSYQVHGIDGGIYNLITDDDMQVNSKFTFISEIDVTKCPNKPWKYAGLTQKIACWSHDGSYLSEIGVMDKQMNKVRIIAGNSENGFAAVMLNDQSIDSSSGSIDQDSITINVFSTHHLSIKINEWTLMIENSDGFVNLASVEVDRLQWKQLSSHGLIGQSWHRPRSGSNKQNKHFEGEVDDYLINENELFGVDFMYNRFNMA